MSLDIRCWLFVARRLLFVVCCLVPCGLLMCVGLLFVCCFMSFVGWLCSVLLVGCFLFASCCLFAV